MMASVAVGSSIARVPEASANRVLDVVGPAAAPAVAGLLSYLRSDSGGAPAPVVQARLFFHRSSFRTYSSQNEPRSGSLDADEPQQSAFNTPGRTRETEATTQQTNWPRGARKSKKDTAS